jgi:hypothetical protein
VLLPVPKIHTGWCHSQALQRRKGVLGRPGGRDVAVEAVACQVQRGEAGVVAGAGVTAPLRWQRAAELVGAQQDLLQAAAEASPLGGQLACRAKRSRLEGTLGQGR